MGGISQKDRPSVDPVFDRVTVALSTSSLAEVDQAGAGFVDMVKVFMHIILGHRLSGDHFLRAVVLCDH